MKIIIILIILTILLIFLFSYRLEHHDSGALIQLMAKDQQDMYLTGDVYGYYNPYIRLKKSEMPFFY